MPRRSSTLRKDENQIAARGVAVSTGQAPPKIHRNKRKNPAALLCVVPASYFLVWLDFAFSFLDDLPFRVLRAGSVTALSALCFVCGEFTSGLVIQSRI
jgi:hypothetical protein